MKKLLTTLLVLVSLQTFSQVFINFSFQDMKDYALKYDFRLTEGYTTDEDSLHYVMLEDDSNIIGCYFDNSDQALAVRLYSFSQEDFKAWLSTTTEKCIELKPNEWIRYFEWGVVHVYLEVIEDYKYPILLEVRETY